MISVRGGGEKGVNFELKIIGLFQLSAQNSLKNSKSLMVFPVQRSPTRNLQTTALVHHQLGAVYRTIHFPFQSNTFSIENHKTVT